LEVRGEARARVALRGDRRAEADPRRQGRLDGAADRHGGAPRDRGAPRPLGVHRPPGEGAAALAPRRGDARPSRPLTEEVAPGARRLVVGALLLAISLAAVDATIVAPAVPQIVGDLGGFHQFPWLFSIYLLAQAVLVPIYGRLADVFGREATLLLRTGVLLGVS